MKAKQSLLLAVAVAGMGYAPVLADPPQAPPDENDDLYMPSQQCDDGYTTCSGSYRCCNVYNPDGTVYYSYCREIWLQCDP